MDRIRATSTLAAPAPLDSAGLDIVLRDVARRLSEIDPGTIMNAGRLHSEVQVAVWNYHGIYNDAAVGRDINTVLGHVNHLRLTGTRDEYSLRLRLMLAGVSV